MAVKRLRGEKLAPYRNFDLQPQNIYDDGDPERTTNGSSGRYWSQHAHFVTVLAASHADDDCVTLPVLFVLVHDMQDGDWYLSGMPVCSSPDDRLQRRLNG
jgi:hypothetical protein